MSRTPLILIVDDEEIIRNILEKLIRALGFEAITAASSSDALAMIDQQRPDLILLDIMIPGSNSMEIIETVREDQALNKTAIVMISGTDDLNAIASFIKAGADDFLLKPFNATLFKARIVNVLEQISIQQEKRGLLSAIADGKLKLTKAESARDQFCSKLSHDLNNALTGIMMAGDLLLMGELPDHVTKGIDNILESTEEMTRIIKQAREKISPR
ncbi:response regulator [Mariprofundus sp. KV]|uniref:ATP-binding response regulator n=1 Tax=Mariprofundus sp. KV TaxID=2608715 RepID=UPI0015A0F43F|nr:response regulator [Mariprofundus sp. KV]NWF36314.1 response regulator [Mariprofundus sp. KV]